MPSVKAIEEGTEQTEPRADEARGVWRSGLRYSRHGQLEVRWNAGATEGESPVEASRVGDSGSPE